MTFELPKLNYDYNALEPYIDARTMEIHHSKHHAGYTNNLNNAISGTEFEKQTIDDILKNPNLPAPIKNNGGGYYNHCLFWDILSPNPGKGSSEFISLIEKTIIVPKKFTFEKFIKDTSIATSTMMVNRNIIKGINFTNTKICEDYFFKCKILKKINFAHCLNESLTKYRIRRNSLQSSKIRNLYWIWTINKKYNKLNFFQNLNSIISISLNSLKKYGYK